MCVLIMLSSLTTLQAEVYFVIWHSEIKTCIMMAFLSYSLIEAHCSFLESLTCVQIQYCFAENK